MKVPLYCIFGARPVKIERGKDGRIGAYSFNWNTGDFDLDMSYLNRAYGGYAGNEMDLEEVTKIEFEQYVANLKNKLNTDTT